MSTTQINSSDIKEPFNSDIILGTGIDIFMMQSGTSNIGTAANPLSAVYANNLFGTFGTGLAYQFVHTSGDAMTGSLTMGPSANIVASQSGNNVGQPSFPFQNGYINNLVANNVSPTVAGAGDLGTVSNPFNVLYVNSIVSTGGAGDFVNVTGDSMTGGLFTPSLGATIVTGSSASFTNITGTTLVTGTTLKGQSVEAGIMTANSIEAKVGQAINVSGVYGYVDVYSNGIIRFASSVTQVTGSSAGSGGSLIVQGSGGQIAFSDGGSFIGLGDDTIIYGVSGTCGIGNPSGIPLHGSLNPLGNAIKHAYIHNVIATNITGTFITGTTGYFSNLTIGSAPYVAKSGDSMSGNLIMNGTVQIATANITGNSVTGVSIQSGSGGDYSRVVTTPTGITLFNSLGGSPNVATISVGDAAGAQPFILFKSITGGGGSTYIQKIDSDGVYFTGASTSIFRVDNGTPFIAGNNSSFKITPTGMFLYNQERNMLNVSNSVALGIETSGNITTQGSGTFNIGSVSNPFNIIYANSIVSTGSAGDFVNITGDTMTGNLNFDFNAGVTANNNITLTATSTASGSIVATSTSGISFTSSLGDIQLNTAKKISITGNTSVFMSSTGGPVTVSAATSGITITTPGRLSMNGNSASIAVANNLIELIGSSGEYLVSEGSNIYVALGGSGSKNWVANNSSTDFYKPIKVSGNVSPIAFMSGSTSLGAPATPFGNVYAKNFIDTVTTITGLTFTATTGNSIVLVNSTGTATIGLPIFESGYNIVFKDKAGAANLTDRRISVTGIGCTMDGSAQYDINSNYGRLRFVSDGANWFRIE